MRGRVRLWPRDALTSEATTTMTMMMMIIRGQLSAKKQLEPQ
jgi:hypothetical protein